MSWENYEDVLEQLRAGGLDVEHLQIGTAQPIRCREINGDREKRGWYWLSEILVDGEGCKVPLIVGSFGVYRGNDSGKQKVRLGKRSHLTDDQKAAIAARHQANAKRMKAIREAQAVKASGKATHAWSAYVQDGQSAYLERKKVKAHGIRFAPSGNGTIAIPMADESGKIHGLQIIRAERRPGQLEKEYWPRGIIKQGHYHLIGTPRDLLLVAEGYATAATLHEATGLPVAVAFDANNLLPVSQALSKRYRSARILVCADDDYLSAGNPGVTAAQAAAMAVNGRVVAPRFPADREGKKLTDFNDLALFPTGGLHLVARQIEEAITEAGWDAVKPSAAGLLPAGGGESVMPSLISVEDAVQRFWGTYGMGGKVLFDEKDRRLVHKDDVMNLLPPRSWDMLKTDPRWRVARDTEVGFDPTEQDLSIRCNLFGGWPSVPIEGKCEALLDLLYYLCSNEANSDEVYGWILKWLAYPIQHRGAKMHTALVIHGPQGTGKSRFFEAYGKIFGPYFRVLGQEALEDKFNADWAEKKLFILADEVLARQDMYHIKNRLKGFVTGDTIRVNPKNVAAHTERNHMNIVFLSNERMPLVMEKDDRRHVVIWVPPKLSDSFFEDVNSEIESGGIEALHYFLLNLDLGDFKPWTKPPMTRSKSDLQELGKSSEERFLDEWVRLELEGPDGNTIPLCPCLGSHLYQLYERWCERHGERKRGQKDLISLCGKTQGWSAGESNPTWMDLNDRTIKNRKMVIPSEGVLQASLERCATGKQREFMRDKYSSKAEWLTSSFFAFSLAMGFES